MTGTFKTKTRVYTSPKFVTPISGRKSFVDAAIDFRRGLIENSSMAVLNADLAVKAAMGAGLSASAPSIGQAAQGTSPDTDGTKRVNKGGVPGMEEDEEGYRYMPEATWGPGKVLKLFPSQEERQSSNKVPNFGFVDQKPSLTPEQFVEQMENKPKIRMSKYKINTRTGEPIEDTEVEFDRMRFGKTFDLNPDASDEIDEEISEDASDEMQEKSLGSSLKQRMPGSSIAGRAAARFGVIMDELGKMRCPPGTPAANQFTDMTGSNCFGVTPGNIISEAINLAQRLVPQDDPSRGGFAKRIANFMFDMENGIFGNNVWYHADGTRMKHGEWRKFREAGGVAKNERWMVNGVERVFAELEAQDARIADLYAKLGVDVSDAKKATNDDVYEAFQKLKESGTIPTEIFGRPTPAQVEAMMTARLKNMDAHWIARTDDEKKILLDIEVKRYRELERAHLEAFLDEVIKNPEHMKSIREIKMVPGGDDRASYGILGIDRETGMPVGSIDVDIPNGLAFQDSMLPNLSPDERLRIWAEGGQSDAVRAMAVKDFLVNSNSHAGQMIAMVDGGRGLGRHDMKHEIAHSIQAAAIFEHMKRELDARGSLIIPGKGNKKDTVITSVDQLTSTHLMNLMMAEDYMGIDLETLNNLRSRGDVVAFLAGRYIWDVVEPGYGGHRRAAEIGAELWALRSSGLIYGDDVDAALEYMDDIVSGRITADRSIPDSVLTERIHNEHLDGTRRIREAREARERAALDEDFFDADERAAEARMSAAREAYAQEKRAEVKATKEAAKTMTEEEMVDFLATSTEFSDALSELLDAADEAGEEADWMRVMDRDTLDAQSKAVADEWVKRFTVRRSPEAMEKLQKMIDDKRESKGTLSPEKIEERRYREFLENATERAKDMDLAELVQHYSDWEEMGSGEGIDAPERARMKQVRDMYRDEYIKRRTEGPDSVSKEDARKEFNSKFKELRKPKTVAERERQSRVKPKKFTSHNGKNGARTFATEERARLLEGATTAEKIAFVEMGSGETDVINMMGGYPEGMAAARAIQRRNTRLKKNGILPDQLNQHEASIEEQVENFYIPLLELMDKSSLSQTVEMHIDSNDDTAGYVADLLNGNPPNFTNGINVGTLATSSTDFSDGKKIIVRFPEGSKALFPDWSYSSESDNGEQKVIFPPSKLHLVEVRDDGTVVLEVGEQMGAEAALKDAVKEIGPWSGGSDYSYREGLQKKVKKVVDKRIEERRRQGMFDPESRSPIEEERFSTTADTASSAAGFAPDMPPPPPSRIDADGKPQKPRGVNRRRSTAAIDRAKDASKAQKELETVHAFLTGEGAYQGRTNFIGTKVASIMESNFGTRNISELTEEQKYDLIDLIAESIDKAPKDQHRGLSQARSMVQDHIDISRMIQANDFSDPYSGSSSLSYLDADRFNRDDRRMSSGSSAKWGEMPSSNEQIARLLEPSNNDGFNEIYGPPQTREERIAQMTEMQSEVMTSLREMIDNVPGAGDSLGLEMANIDPVLADFIKNSSDEEIYNLVAEAAKNLHESFDSRPRIRMRQDELDKFAASGRYGREESFNTERLSSGLVKKGIKARAKERAIEMIADRIGKDEDSREIAEMVINTASALKYGPEAALTRLAIDLGRRGSRDIAERTVQELVERGKITDEQAKSIMSKIDKVAPEGLPEPIKRGVGRAARAATEALDTPENRERLDRAREAAGEAAGRAREAVGEGARNIAERGRERLRKLRERDDAGSLPSAPEDVPFGDFDPADAPVNRFASGRRLDRRVASSDVGRERIMEGANVTRTRLSSGETPKSKPPRKPFKPREPDNGPMTGKFIDIFRGVKSYQEMLDRYNEQEVIFFDYETTGLEPGIEKPVQIGAVKMKGGKVVERFNIFVNPGKELSDWSKQNLVDADGNPLTDDWLSKQTSIADAHQQLVDFFGPNALLGGQYTPFDLGFLEQSLKDSGIEWTPAGVVDSKALADELLPKWSPDNEDGPFLINDDGVKKASSSLGPLSEYLGVELTAWHTADADSEASAMVFQKTLERAAEREDVPKHLLDVDNIPNIVNERRAKHKLEMDKYNSEMKKYKADMDAYNASRSREASSGGNRLSSGETYKELVRTQGRPSEKQREAISDVKDLLEDEEFGTIDEWTYEDGVVDSPKRAELKQKIASRITEAFSHDIEAREDVFVTAKNGEKINLGKDFEVSITEISVDVDQYGEETLEQIREQEMYDTFTGLSGESPTTVISMKIAIRPKDKEALKRFEEAGIPAEYLSDIYGKPGADDVEIGHSSRNLVINGDQLHATHESLFIRDAAKGKGIGSLFNAKNEGVYEEMGVQRIFTQGQSSELGESEGGTHWPRNGFTWAGEKSKQDFIKVIDDALRKKKSKFSEEERARISSLYRKNPSTGKFETDASAEELVDFKYADRLFQEEDVEFMFKRDIELASSGSSRFSSGETPAARKVSLGRKKSGIPEKAQEEFQSKIDAKTKEAGELKELNRRLRLAMEELKSTGSWQGEKYDIRINDQGVLPPVTATREEIEAQAIRNGMTLDEEIADYVKDIEAAGRGRKEEIDRIEKEVTKLKETKDFIGKDKSDTTFHIEELLADTEMAEELQRRSKEVESLSYRERSERFTDPNDPDAHYVIHWGASELKGGELDPARSRGTDDGSMVGNTRAINVNTAKPFVEQTSFLREQQEKKKKLVEDISNGKELKVGPKGRTLGQQSAERNALESAGLGKWIDETSGEVQFDKMKEELGDGYDDAFKRLVTKLKDEVDREEGKLKTREKLAEQLRADGYQYSSAYSATALQWGAGSYGGRYADEGTEIGSGASFGDRTAKSPITGIHIFRVTPETATSLGGGEEHLIGKHTPIASLVADNNPMGDNPAHDTWAGWVDMAIQEDIAKRANAPKATRLSSGEGLRSPGLKANRDRPMSEYGMEWKPEYSDKEWVKPAKTWEGWDNIPITEVELSSEIRPTESHLKGSSIDKVVSGEEAFREGYHPNIVIDKDGKMYVSDGHNRVAMHRALGNEKMTARVIDLRKQDAPWGDKTPDTAETRLSSGEGPRSKKPTRVKKYKGYELKEPDNPTPKDGEYPQDIVDAAKEQRDKVAKVEAEITKLLIDLAEKNKANMEGLDYRMKALKSLIRKIAAEVDEEHGGDAKKAAAAMSDIARYTMSYEPEDYIAGVKDVVEQMQALGYELNVKNYWKGGDPYQGINVAVVHPDGTRFELQFHTPQSVADKEKIHAIYEDYRTEKDPRKRFEMYNRMVRMAEKIGVPYPPDELLKIGNVKEQPFS